MLQSSSPPHKLSSRIETIQDSIVTIDPHFTGHVYNYDDLVKASLDEPTQPYALIKTAVPSWDNDARRQGNGTTFAHATPAKYEDWLHALVMRARGTPFAGEAIVCVNAWNEWAEGAYLEPDVHFGSAYLNATARAISLSSRQKGTDKAKVLLVGHDAYQHGAQMTLLHLGRTMARRFGVEVAFVILGEGPLLPLFREVGEVIVSTPLGPDLAPQLNRLHARGFRLAITNTVVAGHAVPDLARAGFRILSLVHELPRLIREYKVEAPCRAIATQSDIVVFPDRLVERSFADAIGSPLHRVITVPQGLYANILQGDREVLRRSVREELALPQDTRIVLGIGYADLRKGIDLFVDTARRMFASHPTVTFVWIGKLEQAAATWIVADLAKGEAANVSFRHVDFTEDVGRYLQAADAFYLTSREDPFPSTVLEALACGLPVVGFAGCTGSQSLIDRFGGTVPAFDTAAAGALLLRLIDDNTDEQAKRRRAAIDKDYRWEDYAFRLLQELEPSWQRISVVVPNYNYSRYLDARLNSIFVQTVPVFEVIVLDDASSDNSLDVIEASANSARRDITIIPNKVNAGSIMRQWSKGAATARGDRLWIAEADDSADPAFLAGLSRVSDEATLFAFSDSKQVDSDGILQADSYSYYFERFHGQGLAKGFTLHSRAFAQRFLSVSNIILNVSSVLFRRDAIAEVLENEAASLQTYRFAGDWRTYISLCNRVGTVAFVKDALNIHRRHAASATHSTGLQAHLDEIARVHKEFVDLLRPGPEAVVAQGVYLEEVRQQFGLHTVREYAE